MKYSEIKIVERLTRATPNEWRTMSNVDKICYALCMAFDKRKSTTHQDVIAAKQGAVDFLTYSKNAADNNQVERCLANFHKGNWCSSGNGGSNSGGGDSNNGTTDNTGNNGTTGNTGNSGTTGNTGNNSGNDNGGDGNGGVASVADTFSSEMGTFEGLIDQGDWDGAIAFLDANPDFEGAIGSTFRSDIQGKIDADAAVERNRIAQEEAEEAEEAAATAAAEKQAQEEAEAAELAASIAAEEAQARIDAIELEREAEEARIAQAEAEADRLEAEAAATRKAAEKLERERIEAEEEAALSADTGESEIEEFDWEDLQ